VLAPKVEQYQPNRPAPLKLEDETFVACPHEDPALFVCMTFENARKLPANKVKTLQWIKDADAVIDFYERSGSQAQSK
jgi:hypothetical protein